MCEEVLDVFIFLHEDGVMGICAGAGEDFQPGALSWRKRQLCCLESESRRGRMGTSSCIQDLGVALGLRRSLARLRGSGRPGRGRQRR